MFPTTADLASACYTMYETADGQWLALGALEPKFWRGFCERIGRSDLITKQFAGGDEGARVARDVGTIMRSRTRDEWLAHFADVDVCLTPVLTPAEAQPAAVRLKPDTTYEKRADATQDRKLAPELGADTEAVLQGAGIGADERARLRAARVI